jgi:flavin reductase (DIM6/NTAB) family NADH-FMN oxidoreductase RutF
MNKNALRALSYGVYIISTYDEGRPTGCTANSVMQITSSPATVAVSINKDNYTHDCIKRLGKFAVSVIGENSDPILIGGFGFRSGRDTDKFANVDYSTKSYFPVINDAVAYMVCEVREAMDAGTHTVFLAEVIDADTLKNDAPMTYKYYHEVIKGTSPKKAPTYIEEQ